jgi:hypothetical protein
MNDVALTVVAALAGYLIGTFPTRMRVPAVIEVIKALLHHPRPRHDGPQFLTEPFTGVHHPGTERPH